MDCENCGEPSPEKEFEVCSGAFAYEVSNCDHPILDCKGLMTCNCCKQCRDQCLKSMQEEYQSGD